MLLLASTTDVLSLVTGQASQIEVHADYVDLAAGVVTPGRQNTVITTATTTTIVAAPGASTVRNVKNLKISNNHASASCTVTLRHTDGATLVGLESVTLAAGERMALNEFGQMRIIDALGREKVPGLGQSTGNSNTADVVANAADTYLTGSGLLIGGRVQAGSFFKWRFRATKTAAGAATPTFTIRTGSAGSVADAARVTLTSTAAQTNVADTGAFELDAILRSVGATAVLQAWIRMDHTSVDGAGLGTFRYIAATSASFALAATDIIGVSCNPGASGVWTFQNVSIEANNLIS